VGKRRLPYLSGLILLVCAGCGTGEQVTVERAATASAPSAAEEAGETGEPIPGDEALTPAPPDPAAEEHQGDLAALPDGRFAGTLDLTVSGLTGFSQRVAGSCSSMGSTPTLEFPLSDGSTVRVSFQADGGSLLLAAPGIEVRQTLDAVELTAGSDSLRVAAELLTEGTTENSGRLLVEGTCS
jgi:hypothetical protein